MIAFRVHSATGDVLAIFRHEQQARAYLEEHRDRPEPIFRAVEISGLEMSETIWNPWFRALTQKTPPTQ